MPDDARLLELTWLTEMEQHGSKSIGPFAEGSSERRLAVYLLFQGYANDESCLHLAGHGHVSLSVEKETEFLRRLQVQALLVGKESVEFRISHRGAVRRAELEQQLKSNRIKEPMGLVWDGRHFHQDTRIALLDAAPERPLSVAYLDLNDVKRFNEKSHAAGDDAIRRYLEVIAELTFDCGDAYRLSGGADEVVILLPRLAFAAAVGFTRTLLAALGREVVHEHTLRAAAGVVVATDPVEAVDVLKKRADAEQGRAKTASRAGDGRPSVLAWPDGQCEVQTTT